MSKPSPARSCTTSWSAYNAALRRRGSLLVWRDREMEWSAPKRGRPGRPEVFSGAAIQFCLSLKVPFGLALRQAIGMVAGLPRLAGLDWPAPDCSTLCRGQRTVTVPIPCRRSGGSLNLLVDRTGVKMAGESEWQVRRHGASRRRQWRKGHLAMDMATGDVRAVEFTPSRAGNSPGLPDLLAQIPRSEQIGTVTADGACDTRACHTAIAEQGANEAPRPPSRSAGTAVPGRRIAPPPGRGARPCAPHGTSAGPVSDAADRHPCPKPDRSPDAPPQSRRQAHRPQRPRPPDRRDPHPHRPDDPLLRPRQGQDRAPTKPQGKGRGSAPARIAQ